MGRRSRTSKSGRYQRKFRSPPPIRLQDLRRKLRLPFRIIKKSPITRLTRRSVIQATGLPKLLPPRRMRRGTAESRRKSSPHSPEKQSSLTELRRRRPRQTLSKTSPKNLRIIPQNQIPSQPPLRRCLRRRPKSRIRRRSRRLRRIPQALIGGKISRDTSMSTPILSLSSGN